MTQKPSEKSEPWTLTITLSDWDVTLLESAIIDWIKSVESDYKHYPDAEAEARANVLSYIDDMKALAKRLNP